MTYSLGSRVNLLIRVPGFEFLFGNWKFKDDFSELEQKFHQIEGILNFSQTQIGVEFLL